MGRREHTVSCANIGHRAQGTAKVTVFKAENLASAYEAVDILATPVAPTRERGQNSLRG
jgi:hypothetical protein